MEVNLDMNMKIDNEDFLEAEAFLGFKIPPDLKKMLSVNGYSALSIIADITEQELTEIQLFAREKLPKIINENEYEDYYGPLFKNFPEEYTIMSGHKKILNKLKNYYEKKCSGALVPCSKSTETRSSSRTESLKSVSDHSCEQNMGARSRSRSPLCQTKTIDFSTENAIVGKTLKSWIRNCCNDHQWEYFENRIDEVLVSCTFDSTNEIKCQVVCFCGTMIKLYRAANKPHQQKRWIYSNFHKHFKCHLKNKNSLSRKSRFKSIKHYFSNEGYCSRSPEVCDKKNGNSRKTKIDIIENITLNIAEKDMSAIHGITVTKQNTEESPVVAEETDGNHFEKKSGNNRDSVDYNPTSDKTKWSSTKYSRRERCRRKREKADDRQLLLTSFIPLIQQVKMTLREDSEIGQSFIENMLIYEGDIPEHDPQSSTELPTSEKNSTGIDKFLNTLIDVSKKNSNVKSNRNFFDDVVKKTALYIYYIGGKLLYETLYSNLPKILPSLSTLSRFITKHGRKIQEGIFDFDGLNKFLEERHVPKIVWIAEDATRITSKIEYDSVNNKVMGFSLPLTKDGVPKTDAFIAESAENIRQYFIEHQKANYAYTIMAQSIISNMPSYCLSIFCTNNKFTHEEVISRWKFIQSEADKYDIKILGFSADGDSRLLKGMRLASQLSKTQNHDAWKWFHMGNSVIRGCSFVQDSVHIGTKLRTRILKPSIVLPLGNFIASSSYLHVLIQEFSKDKHLLVPSDLKAEDKMNFRSAEKMYSDQVRNLLKSIPDTAGTQAFLLVMQYSVTSYCDKTLTIHDRIYRLWYVVFFLRIWKKWILKSKQYTVKNNFISQNCYISLELNAHSLLNLVKEFNIIPELDDAAFTSWLFSSQVCEKLFRATRSMTSTFSTVVNFSIKDIINRINRISAINFILHDLNEEIIFPREAKKQHFNEDTAKVKGTNVEEMKKSVETALKDALKTTTDLGMVVEKDSWLTMELVSDSVPELSKVKDKEGIESNECSDHIEEISIDEGLADTQNNEADVILRNIIRREDEINADDENKIEEILDLSSISSIKDTLKLKDFTNSKTSIISKNSIFTEVIVSGQTMVVKKSSLCWLFDQMGEKVSADRLRRFISKDTKEKSAILQSSGICSMERKNAVSVGDWCIFSKDSEFEMKSSKMSSTNILQDNVIGRILAFSYVMGKKKAYSLEAAPVSIAINRPKRDLGCMCSWYTIDERRILVPVVLKEKQVYNLSNYKATISPNVFDFNVNKSEISVQEQSMEKLINLIVEGAEQEKREDSENMESDIQLDDSSEDNSFSSENEDDIEEEKYYATYYANQWYIGRVVAKENTSYKMKFLRQNMGEFYWPKTEDLDYVQKVQIIYGPLRMIGCEPLTISREDREIIERKYKAMKKGN